MDLLIVNGRGILPVEIKLGTVVGPREVAGLRQCMKDLKLKRGIIVSRAPERRRLSPSIEIVPWAEVVSGRFDLD